MSNTAVIILAAGRGERMGNTAKSGPKQYRALGARSVLQRTIDRFLTHPAIDLIQVVIHPDDHDLYRDCVTSHEKLRQPVNGGRTRQASGLEGLLALQALAVDRVLIHDAARPFVSAQTITSVLAAIEPGACALPGVSIPETIKRVDATGQVTETVDRTGLFTAQTPQGFVYREILAAHQAAAEAGKADFTDDAAVSEWFGHRVKMVEVGRDNMKITTADDLAIARNHASVTATEDMMVDIRVGNGYDIHSFTTGNQVVLCGVNLPFDKTLNGHSDADVGLHSLTDALLATVAEGDIGTHFPPSDPQWKNAKSDQFLRFAVNRVKAHHGKITHLDVTLICERPKIGPHRETMRQAIADMTGVAVSRISVKATTHEKIGAVGRQEGIAAIANATVIFQPPSSEPPHAA